MRPVLAMLGEVGSGHLLFVGRIAMEEDAVILLHLEGMDVEVGLCGGVAIERFDKASVGVVIAKDEVKAASAVARDEVVEPVDGSRGSYFGAAKGGPAEVKDVATENERTSRSRSGVERLLMDGSQATFTEKVKVRNEVGLISHVRLGAALFLGELKNSAGGGVWQMACEFQAICRNASISEGYAAAAIRTRVLR